MKSLTQKQKTILDYIQSEIDKHGVRPTYRQVMKAMHYASVSTVATHIKALYKKGYLQDHPSPQPSPSSLPLIGHFSDGKPLEISATANVQIPIYLPIKPKCSCYALRVQGNSLACDAILDGDILIIEARSQIETGEVAFAQTENGFILRKVDFQGPHICLSHICDAQNSCVLPQSEVTLQAVLLTVLRHIALL